MIGNDTMDATKIRESNHRNPYPLRSNHVYNFNKVGLKASPYIGVLSMMFNFLFVLLILNLRWIFQIQLIDMSLKVNILRSTGSCFMWSISRHSTGEEDEDSTENGNPDYTQIRDQLQGDRSNINLEQDIQSRTHDTTQLNRIRVLLRLQSKRLPGVQHQLETWYLDFS